MANQYNNKVVTGDGTTLIDITDTTAEEADVVSGKTFYKKSGERSTGSAVITPVDQHYDGTSANAQSGTAVAEAIETVKIIAITNAEIDTIIPPVQ